jgi:hypothetical protein
MQSHVVSFPARDACLRQGLRAAEFVQSLVTMYRRERCEGLFLSAVSFEGIRIPIAEIVTALSHFRPPRFVVVDGAQALAHVPPTLPECDIYLAGCHKWLGAGHAMGVVFQPRPRSHDFLRGMVNEMLAVGDLDDPLLNLIEQLEGGCESSFGETVSLDGLFSSGAAVAAAVAASGFSSILLETRLANATAAGQVAGPTGWEPLLPEDSFRSGILLLQGQDQEVRAAPAEELRAGFQQYGVAVTTYPGGLARLSLPPRPWKGKELDRLRAVLQSCA